MANRGKLDEIVHDQVMEVMLFALGSLPDEDIHAAAARLSSAEVTRQALSALCNSAPLPSTAVGPSDCRKVPT